ECRAVPQDDVDGLGPDRFHGLSLADAKSRSIGALAERYYGFSAGSDRRGRFDLGLFDALRRTWRNGQHRANTRVQNALCRAHEKKTANAAVPVCAEEDELRLDVTGDVCDLEGGVARGSRQHPKMRIEPVDPQLLDLLRDPLLKLGLVGVDRIPGAAA